MTKEQTINNSVFVTPVSAEIWAAKYRLTAPSGEPVDRTVSDTWARVARAVAAAEKPRLRDRWARRFHDAMADFAFLPAGRILAGAGTDRRVTLFNCFVMGEIGDDLGSIFDNLKEAALTLQQGGGIGHDFSTLRPKGALVKSVGADASGPVSFMDVWDAMCRTIMSAGARRGAMMATLRCDHPDIEMFIEAKSDPTRLRNFNLSVLVTDAFVAAVEAGRSWDLVFGGKVYRSVDARALWQKLMRATYDYAEPGVIFIDRVNAANNLAYCETIAATNPCGEQPLPPHGACLLGSINLANLVERPFEPGAGLDIERLEALTEIAVRFLDDVIDVSKFPLPAQQKEAVAKRRIGLGITGLANALAMCGVRYGSAEAAELAGRWVDHLRRAAYAASAELAREKGPFPLFERDAFLARPNVASLGADIRRRIGEYGIRNGLLTSIAPTGTISLFANNVSSGIEPVFDHRYVRKVLAADGSRHEEVVEDAAHRLFRARFGNQRALPPAFVTAAELTPAEHVVMQAAVQPHIDSAISKTINCPADISFEDFQSVYLDAYRRGLKGCTTYRPNAVTGSVLSTLPTPGKPANVGAAAAVPAAVAVAGPLAKPVPPPLPREPVLSGYTYKLRWPESDHAIYVTLNDTEVDGVRRPFEIFINSKNLEHYAWTVALTRMISAVFRRGGDVGFVVEELKSVFDPRGGQWLHGQYVPSLLAAIGGLIETHMQAIGFLPASDRARDVSPPSAPVGASGTAEPATASLGSGPIPGARFCPQCQLPTFVQQEGCFVCRTCGYSKCS